MKQPLKNLFSLIIGDVGGRVLGFLITVYLARVLAPSAFGVINIGLSVLSYLMLLASPGMQLLETRNAASVEGTDEERVNSILSLRFVLAAGLLILTVPISFVAISSGEVRESVVLFSLCLIPLSLFPDWFFQGKEQFAVVSKAKMIMYLMYGCIVILCVHSIHDIVWVPIGFASGNLAATIFLLVKYRRFGRFKFAWRLAEWRTILATGVPVGLAVFLAQSAMNLPPIAIGWFVSTAEAGVFSAALKIIFVMLMVDRFLNAMLLPVVTRYFASRRDETLFVLSAVIKLVLVLALPLSVCGVLLSPLAVSLVFGNRYAEAIPLLQLLMGYFFLTVLNSVFVCSLIAAGKEKEYTATLNVGSAVSLIGIVAGAAFVGSRGAAFGVVAGELCTVLLMIMQTRKIVALPLLTVFLRPFIAAAAMIACVVLLSGETVLMQILFSLPVFAIALVLTRGIEAKEIRFLRERFV